MPGRNKLPLPQKLSNMFHNCESTFHTFAVWYMLPTLHANSLYFVAKYFALDPSINNYTVQTVQCLQVYRTDLNTVS